MFKNIKSLFIIEEEEAKSKQPLPQKPETTAPKTPTATPVMEVPVEGKVTQEFMDILFHAMEQANPQGFDYMEFKQSLQSLKKMQMDDATRYRSAFAMAQTLGTTSDKLLQSAQFYLDILKKEEQKFAQAVDNQRSKLIGNRQSEIGQLEQAIQSKEVQIKQLTQEIQTHRQQKEQLQKEIQEATVKVGNTQQNFIASYKALSEQIAQDIENMKQFLLENK